MKAPPPARIVYRFHLASGPEEILLEFDPDTYLLRLPPAESPPGWAALDFNKCPNCPLSSDTTPLCPFADALSRHVERFGQLVSHDEALIEVETGTRRISARKPLQTGIASLVGLIGATSGCPHLAFYRPMARFHLPFADDTETLYRVLSMFLLRALLDEEQVDLSLLAANMDAVGTVNQALAVRIRDGFDKDAMVNAIVILDCFAQSIPIAIQMHLDPLRPYFDEWP